MFRSLTEALIEVDPLASSPLGRAGLESYFLALQDMACLHGGALGQRQQIIRNLSSPGHIEVGRAATEQTVSLYATVLGETAIRAASLAVGLEYNRYNESHHEGFYPKRVSTMLCYGTPVSWYVSLKNWRPPFDVSETGSEGPGIGAAARADYGRSLGIVLGVIRQFNAILTPMAGAIHPDHSSE